MSTDAARPSQVIELPGWRPIVRRVFATPATVSLLPMAVFYTTMNLYGLRAAALATVSLYYGVLLWKVVRRRPILAAALLTAGGFVVLKSVLGPALTITAVAASLLYLHLAMRSQHVHIRWRQRTAPAGAA